MHDSVPTRLERLAAVVAVLAALALVPAAALESMIAVVVLLFVASTCGTIAKARVDIDAFLTFGLRSVSDDDPDATRYRERRRQQANRLREAVSLEYDAWLDRLLAVGLVVVGIGALVVVVTAVDDIRNAPRLLAVAVIALNAALVVYGVSSINREE
ncbi:hypothetical protein [Halobiforma nitratireducens]|uniref:Uncharacterized protein n=1 Tax=Halobiforma nitratireducens JCM 10879 TaxID=1227454 RepID=M0M8V2_9EURY|nr:hypothetical protein [Halobiforma nitratireducens]EMA41024.1 hypothetical protein C446_06635 [Halobiforma nitratireducens JCM 10879]